ncbi:hypothetical protein [Mycobacterium sp.]|uniref:hypothetical protein n=1 Tax=Mycobacterium sp. TaxID=1785 RepID=UPI002CDF620A|nr:hypothetical protein [Mycobacterium sp.]HKP39858.1 hypothetical protein [Mycobacterium sp.]
MQTWFYRLPAAARAPITGVLSAAAIFGVMSLYTVSAPWGDTGESVTARIVVSMIAGMLTGVIGVVLGDQRMHRIYGSTDDALRYKRALRTGELPAEIEPAVWQGWLAVSSQSNRWAPAAVGVFAVLAVLQGLDHQWMLAALFALLAIWQSAVALVLRRRIARLTAAVGQRAAAAG